MIKEFLNKKSTKIVAIILFSVFFILSVLTVVSVIGYRKIFTDIKEFKQITPTHNIQISTDDKGYTTIRNIDNNEGLNVLQLTDLHIGCSIGTYTKDKMAFESIYKIISNSRPDFVVVTGDLCYPFFLTLGINNKLQAQVIAEFFEQIGVYWTFNFGNHEDMGLVVLNAKELGNLFSGYEHCLFKSGEESIDGVGNYFIKILNNDNTLNSALVFMDSNSYLDGFGKYDKIHNNQIEWYEKNIKRLSAEYNLQTYELKTFLFIHIPLQAYSDAYNKYKNNDSSVKYIAGRFGEGICAPANKDNFFDKIVELGSTKAIFCGHDHLNNGSLLYKNVLLSYGMSIDYLAYIGIHKKSEQRGGQLIKIKENNTFSLTQILEMNNYNIIENSEVMINI